MKQVGFNVLELKNNGPRSQLKQEPIYVTTKMPESFLKRCPQQLDFECFNMF